MDPVRQWFNAIDVDRNGQLDSRELQKALAEGNLHVSLMVCQHLIRIHDKGGTQTVNFEEFQRLHGYLCNMQSSFVFFDTNKNGQLSLDEVKKALEYAGFRLDDTSFYTTCRAFDPNRSATLGLGEFIAMSLFLQSASATFSAFDPQRTGQVSLTFNQFIYAAANTV